MIVKSIKMQNTIRGVSCTLLELIESQVLDAQMVVEACLSKMSEQDVADMVQHHGFISND